MQKRPFTVLNSQHLKAGGLITCEERGVEVTKGQWTPTYLLPLREDTKVNNWLPLPLKELRVKVY